MLKTKAKLGLSKKSSLFNDANMIFCFHFALIMAGYCSVGLLLGRYMILYGGASELDLGLLFLIHPLSMFLRPIVCATADRNQNHRKLLVLSLLANSISYVPFVVIPLLLTYTNVSHLLTTRLCFWILVVSHTFGSLSFCGIRSLGDALAINYAKRIGVSFSYYRKWGSIGFGSVGFLLGYVNQNSFLPDYTPAVLTNVICLFVLMLMILYSSDDYFVMVIDPNYNCVTTPVDYHAEQRQDIQPMSKTNGRTTIAKLGYIIPPPLGSNQEKLSSSTTKTAVDQTESSDEKVVCTGSAPVPKRVTFKQQAQTFMLLVSYDIRIPMFLLVLCLGGMTGYAPPNFVYTYIDKVCNEKGCDAGYLSGLTMISYCLIETTMYEIIHLLRGRLSHVIRLQITLASLAFHYFFYAFALRHLSPYFFLVESLHGIEYSISLSTGVELGYHFANQVGIIMPELIRRRIISEHDDPEMIRKSLLATMNSIFTLTYEGAGTIVGTLIYGLVIDAYSFETAWLLNAIMSTSGLILVMISVGLGKCLRIEPKILKLQHTTPQPNDVL